MHSPTAFALLLVATAVQGAAAANFDWDCTNSLGPCNNACFAVNHGLAPAMLNYDADVNNRDPRRTASGCNRNPCNNGNLPYGQFGNSCDEYPFASTHQGGTNAILRCVDGTENSSEGGQLSAFYRTINDGDQFGIFVRNFGGAQFCENANAGNDGSEFRLSGGTFVNAKFRLRRALGFEDAVPDADKVVNKLREYEDEEGGRVLSLTNKPGVTLVGQTISNGTRTLRIVKEITRK